MATRGSSKSQSARAMFAVATAMFASSSAFGHGFTTQSAKTSSPFSPNFVNGLSSRKAEETSFIPGAVLMICSAGRSMSPVE